MALSSDKLPSGLIMPAPHRPDGRGAELHLHPTDSCGRRITDVSGGQLGLTQGLRNNQHIRAAKLPKQGLTNLASSTRIVLVRHGHVAGIRPERFRGRANLELTKRGLLEARATAERIEQHWRPAMVYSSPMQRCMTTGQIIADAAGVPLAVLDGLNDIDHGEWQGRSHEEVKQQWPAQYRRWLLSPHLMRFPGGESLRQLSTRVANALRLTVEKHLDTTTVIVGHVSGNRVLLLQALGLPLSAYWRIAQDPCGLSEIIITDDDLSVQRINDTAHLEPQESSAPA